MKSGENGKDFKGAVVQKDKREQNLLLLWSTSKQFCIWFVELLWFWWRGSVRIRRAAVFWIFYIGSITELGEPARRELQQSNLDNTHEVTSCFNRPIFPLQASHDHLLESFRCRSLTNRNPKKNCGLFTRSIPVDRVRNAVCFGSPLSQISKSK